MDCTRSAARSLKGLGLSGPTALLVVGFLAPGLVEPSVASECLDRPAEQITVIAPGSYTEAFEVSPPGDFHTYDMRGANFTANPPLQPVEIEENLNGACVVGPRVVGQQSRDLTWDEIKDNYDGDGVRFVHRSGSSTVGHVTAEGLWIDNVEDGLEPVRYTSSAGLGYSWTLRSSYFRYIRDDVIENDSCHAGEVIDVLVDNSHTFISSRPGSGKDLQTGAMAPVIKIYDSAIHVGAADEARAAGDRPGRIWKWPGSSSSCTPEPVVDVRNTVFRVDLEHDNMDFPDGTFVNVTIVWLGGGGYPAPVPPGITVTSDVNVWRQARNAWLDRHGCDANGDVCTNLIDPGDGDQPPPDEPPPDEPPASRQQISFSPAMDTYLQQGRPTAAQGSAATLSVDAKSSGGAFQGLVYFDVAGQIPFGSTVLSATLTFETTDRGNGAAFHRMLMPWDENATWAAMANGIQADGIEAEAFSDLSTGTVREGSATFDVTTPVQAWVDGELNHGWALLPLGTNGWDFYSREGAVPPKLSVVFDPCDANVDTCAAPPAPPSPPPPPPAGTQTVSFVSSLDTHLREASPTVAAGALTTVNVDGADAGGEVHGLLAFDVMSKVPAGATILSATLSFETTDRGSGANFHRMLAPWDENATWDVMADGIQADGLEAEALSDLSTGSVGTGSSSFDVATTVQAWVDGEPSYGWALLPLGSNGWDFYSREGAVPPSLTVTYDID